ncbi:MAG TPA: glycerol-3-phosphate 1-O-acyltransferase PlsY [Clostridia bacterium]|nr:glycerol-3-phosphate 1-O-acyltransferase PlsY [Clostridia bacterium]
MQFLYWIAAVLGGYLIGSANFAIIITKCFLHKDVREHGSGNAGTANVARVFGPWIGIATLAGDVVKAIAAMWLGLMLLSVNGMCVAGAACVIGHCFPAYFGLRGGKGVAVTAGVALMLDWRVFLVLLAVYAASALLAKKASISSLVATAALPIVMLLWGGFPAAELILAAFSALLVWIMHRENIKRLLRGEEGRFTFGKRKE